MFYYQQQAGKVLDPSALAVRAKLIKPRLELGNVVTTATKINERATVLRVCARCHFSSVSALLLQIFICLVMHLMLNLHRYGYVRDFFLQAQNRKFLSALGDIACQRITTLRITILELPLKGVELVFEFGFVFEFFAS